MSPAAPAAPAAPSGSAPNPIVLPSLPTVTPGAQSSEFTITKYVMIFGGVLTVLFGMLSQVQEMLPSGSKIGGYIAAALSVVSMLLMLAKALGYTNSRDNQKVAVIQAHSAAITAYVTAQASQNAATSAAALNADS